MSSVFSYIEDEGFSFTSNGLEAIYILPNGRMIFGDFDCGIRGTDHRMIATWVPFNLYEDSSKFWDYVHNELKLVRTVPESMVALVREGQGLTEAQEKLIKKYGYKVERY